MQPLSCYLHLCLHFCIACTVIVVFFGVMIQSMSQDDVSAQYVRNFIVVVMLEVITVAYEIEGYR